MRTHRKTRVAGVLALLGALALIASACAAEDTAAQDAASAAASDAAAAMAAASGAQAGADAADARAGAAEAEASAASATAEAASAAADAAAAAAAEAQAAAGLAQATASGSADAIAEAEAALADAQAAAEAASAQAAAAQDEATAAQAEAAAAREEAAAAQAEAAAAQEEAATAQAEAASAQQEAAELQAATDEAAAAAAFMSPGAGVSVTQARATWSTGYMQAAIYNQLLEELGYDVSEPADNELANDIFHVALAEGEVDFWVNGWIPNHLNFWDDELSDGSLIGDHIELVGVSLAAAGLEGFLTNKALAEEHGIQTLGQINDDPALVALYDAADITPGDGVIQVGSCPDAWNCAKIAAQTFEFNGWDNLEAVHAGYEAMFANAVANLQDGKPFIAYSWSPSGYLTQLIPGDNAIWVSVGTADNVLDGSTTDGFDFNDLPPASLGPEFCTGDPCFTGWPAADIRVVANSDFLAANPAARSLFESVKISVVDVALQNVRYDAGEKTTADVNHHAALWIENNRAQVDEWLQAARQAAS
ncbi:MAG: glycine betaine/L-proline ABC transporter substrate-binding protein ProX [bacterium]|nr:glycine betaine/L-proline ABC transporter substrate-binding protein ProX [bacterium]MCY3953477.1 glycine betaine/L-proline ABC transporter substrate-binding protein ProX [bacterium]